ncbi:MAG: two-component regulator propeller domain-containing protein [Salinivirgaceae bacterium]|nr:two-component regulator propeller domain-containing protein [Salinivirgaceae bacterium]
MTIQQLKYRYRYLFMIGLTIINIANISAFNEIDNDTVKHSPIFKLSKLPKTKAVGSEINIIDSIAKSSPNSTVNQIETDTTVILTHKHKTVLEPGKNSILLPKVFVLPRQEPYRTIKKDTIWQPKQITAHFPEHKHIESPKFKDNAIYDIRYLDMDQGLPSSYVLSVYEDKNNNIWIGFNESGVACYFDKSLIHFNPHNGFPLKSVRSIFQDNKGNMWFGSFEEGVVKYDGEHYTHFDTKQGFPNNWIYDIKEDTEGNIWFATGKGACKYDGHALIVYTQDEGMISGEIQSITIEPSGAIWFASSNGGICKFENQTFTHFNFGENFASLKVNKIAYDTINNKLWIVYSKQNFATIYKDTVSFYKCPKPYLNRFKDITIDKKGNAYISTLSNGFFKFSNNTLTYYGTEEGLSHKDVSTVNVLRDGSIVAGTRGGGINIFNPNSFNHFNKIHDVNNALIWSISQDTSGVIWMGSEMDGIVKYDGEIFSSYNIDHGLRSHIILTTLVSKKGGIWFGGYKHGLSKISDSTLTNYDQKDGITDLNITTLFEDNSENIWIGTWGGGAYMFDGKLITHFGEKQGLTDGNVFAIEQDINGDIWFATDGGGLFRLYSADFDSKIMYNYNHCNDLNTANIYALKKDKFGNLWIGSHSNGGLYLLTTKEQTTLPTDTKFRQINMSDKNANQSITSLAFDQNNKLWIGTENGIYVLPDIVTKNGLNIKKSNQTISFSKGDGLKGLDFYRNAIFCDPENQMWMGTGKCLSSINASNFDQTDARPSVQIDQISITNHYIDFRQKQSNENKLYGHDSTLFKGIKYNHVLEFSNTPTQLKLPFKYNHLTFYFSVQGLNVSNKITLQAMIKGLDNEWITVTDNKIDYRNLPSGVYTFKIRAKDIYGDPGAIETFTFQILSPWWLTWWAYILYVIVFVLITMQVSRWRSIRLIKHKNELSRLVEDRTQELALKNSELNQLLHEVSAQRDEIETQRDTVFKQKQQLQNVHGELSSSIDYAVRIQTALFSDKEELKTYFPENFVIIKPKDKITGDFTFWTKVNDKIIVAVADCTGHGVPGAFMSMLGLTMIREIVNKDKNTNTSEILNILRRELIIALRQKFGPREQNDGLDIAIVAIDEKSKTIQYSGANSPMYLIRNGELIEYKADKASVAIHIKMVPFTSQTFTYSKGDSIYLFTDGFPDQFGGPKSTKLKSKAFKELIQQNFHTKFEDQYAYFIKFFNAWKGTQEQIDDVTLVGIKL